MALHTFQMRSYRLGWVNCDIFYRLDLPMVDMQVKPPHPWTVMKLVFKDYQTVIAGELRDGTVYFRNVPLGEEVDLLTMCWIEDDFHFSATSTQIAENLMDIAPLEMTDYNEIEERLNDYF